MAAAAAAAFAGQWWARGAQGCRERGPGLLCGARPGQLPLRTPQVSSGPETGRRAAPHPAEGHRGGSPARAWQRGAASAPGSPPRPDPRSLLTLGAWEQGWPLLLRRASLRAWCRAWGAAGAGSPFQLGTGLPRGSRRGLAPAPASQNGPASWLDPSPDLGSCL